MKGLSVALSTLLLAHSPTLSSALKCGIKGITEPCLADTDPHYDESIGYAFKDQDAFWAALEGLYVIDSATEYDGVTGEKMTSFTGALFPEDGSFGTYDRSNNKGFTNNTVAGSRFYSKAYRIAPHNGDQTIPIPAMPGLIIPEDAFYTSTFEKDGTARLLGSNGGFQTEFTARTGNNTIAPVSGNTLLGTDTFLLNVDGVDITFEVYSTVFCFDETCSKTNSYRETYAINPVTGEKSSTAFSKATSRKVTEQEWFEAMDQVFTEANLPTVAFTPELDNPYFKKPFDPTADDPNVPECFGGVCPSEEDWRTYDPVYGTSPYVEPSGVLTGGFIAIVSVASVLIALAIFYVVYKRGVERREQRLKEAVMGSIAKQMGMTTSKELSADELEEMFNSIDTDRNGNLSREEIKELVTQAGMVEMSERDYDILIASIDLDGNGTLSFAEFCAFYASIPVQDNFNDA